MIEKFSITTNDGESTIELRREEGQTLVRHEGQEAWHEVNLEQVGDSGLYVLMIDNRPVETHLGRRRGGAEVCIGRHTWSFDVAPWRPGGRRSKQAGAMAGVARIVAPMTGSVVEVRCASGDRVEQGAVLLVIESMKMNNELRSPAAGTVETVPVTPGQRVKQNDLLVAIRTAES